MIKNILGLDLGTNSIGWAVIKQNTEEKTGEITALGSRIIPMSQEQISDFDKGTINSATKARTGFRGVRRLHERFLLRRERLHRALNVLGFLPAHYASEIDFEKRIGQFLPEKEPKLVYKPNAQGKPEFIFQQSFAEMMADFERHQPQLLKKRNGDPALIPYDWTLYYLRKKALTQKIEEEELAWLLLNFNQKRGYYQLRGEEDEENTSRDVSFHSLRVTAVEDSGDKKGKDEIWYNVHLENGWIYRRTSKQPLDWIGKTKDFIVTTDLNEDGSIKKDKDGREKRSFRAPAEDDWTLQKKKTEFDIDQSEKTVGAYIYDTLLKSPNQKIKGKLVRVVERKFYKDELRQILETQQKFHSELQDKNLYAACLEELYEHNEAHRNNIRGKGFAHLFLDDIIFYQRPLKSKISLISDCPFEHRTFLNKKTGKTETEPLKCIARSHPLFQEFRLLQWMKNLRIYQREKVVDGRLTVDVNVTNAFLKEEGDWVILFDWLNNRKDVDQKALLKNYKLKESDYRWNFVEDKSYPCNETRAQIAGRLAKTEGVPEGFLTSETEEALWHILYSVEDKHEIVKALKTFATKHGLNAESFVENFRKFPPFPNDYGAYSAKAIKKLLPLLRMGKYWNESAIHPQTRARIEKIISAEYDERIRDRVREKAMLLKEITDFKGLDLWLVSYIVYDRHSEDGEAKKWKTSKDIERYLKEEFKQHSLRNPIVEQVITETLRVVKDIWDTYGNSAEDFFDEIHVELGREMKNPADKRKRMTEQVTANEATNLRIKALLAELLQDTSVENVRPYSPMQQEILKIYEDGALSSNEDVPDDILKISKTAQPSKTDLLRYKLWLEQQYRSPYTGQMIPLNKLFTPSYEIEHIIPQSRFFDDSFSNKVICESAVNKDKNNKLAYEYIRDNSGKKIELDSGRVITLLTEKGYEDFVKKHYANNRGKMKKLMMDEIPEGFIQRQMNDTRYISKVVKGLLSSIVREKDEQEATSRNVLSSNGSITSILKQDWGLNDVWNEVIAERFIRMNRLTGSTSFGSVNPNTGKFLPAVPLELSKGFSKKRIDHRHHAMDALVIACATRNHINYLNNANANGKDKLKPLREDLKHLLCFKDKSQGANNYRWAFHKPWETFTQDTREKLLSTVVSFKQNLRVINKTVNKHQHWEKGVDGKMGKVLTTQTKGDSWSIRKPMHTPMPYGRKIYSFDVLKIAENVGKRDQIIDNAVREKVKIAFENNNSKITATQNFLKKEPIIDENGKAVLVTGYKVEAEKFRKRQPIFKLSNRSSNGGITNTEQAIKFINKIADFKIRQDLLNHLLESKNDIDLAFSVDGIDAFNAKRKIPVYKLPIAESGDKRFPLGEKIGTKNKWMEAAEGTNLFFAVYDAEKEKRSYETVPLNIVIERQKQGLTSVAEKNDAGQHLLFYLSPNDLVYLPTEEEHQSPQLVNFENLTQSQVKRIYKAVSFTGTTCFFLRNDIAAPIVNKAEFSALNKLEKSIDERGIMIKEFCWKLKVDRIGRIQRLPTSPIHHSRALDGVSVDFSQTMFVKGKQ